MIAARLLLGLFLGQFLGLLAAVWVPVAAVAANKCETLERQFTAETPGANFDIERWIGRPVEIVSASDRPAMVSPLRVAVAVSVCSDCVMQP